MTDINPTILEMGKKASVASLKLATVDGKTRQTGLLLMKEKLLSIKEELMAVNAEDVIRAEEAGLSGPMLKRLKISEKVFNYMLNRLEEVAALDDPVGRVLEGHVGPDGLIVQKLSVPIGVIAIIYESRPNVTTDAASVCLKSGNAVILRGGSEAKGTNLLIAESMRAALKEARLPEDCVQIIKDSDHNLVSDMLAMDQYIDLVIPRGGKGLIKRIAQGTSIPVLKHYEGICHQYIAEDARSDWAVDIVVNSKCQSVEVCNALESALIHQKAAETILPLLGEALTDRGVEIRGCERVCQILKNALPAQEEDWGTEYLAPILSIKIVDSLDEAANHINTWGSGHTDGIITQSLDKSRRFVSLVNSASVLVNASTRLSGGGAYGLGAVVGISTDKLHARGPVGPSDLTTYKWVAYGEGHIRR